MVEAGANEVSNEEMLKGLEFAHKLIKDICNAQLDFIKHYEKAFGIKKVEPTFNNPDESQYELACEFLTEGKLECLYNKGKKEFQTELDNLDVELKDYFLEKEIIAEDDDSAFI
jgi:polyribonucleotide nucleotidyltransferase